MLLTEFLACLWTPSSLRESRSHSISSVCPTSHGRAATGGLVPQLLGIHPLAAGPALVEPCPSHVLPPPKFNRESARASRPRPGTSTSPEISPGQHQHVVRPGTRVGGDSAPCGFRHSALCRSGRTSVCWTRKTNYRAWRVGAGESPAPHLERVTRPSACPIDGSQA